MVKLDRIYTRGGDRGETSLGDGARVPKHALRVTALGEVDEANAALGVARLHADVATDALLGRIQNDLFDLGADVCMPAPDVPALRITAGQVARLEQDIDRLNAALPALGSFVLPAGTPLAACLHSARTIVRRAERSLCALAAGEKINADALCYLNRLSDLLFVLARHANCQGQGDVLWVPGKNRS